MRTHVIPKLGHLNLGRVIPNQVQLLYEELRAKGLSKRSIHHVHTILRSALKKAVKLGLIPRNPCDSAEAPTPEEKEAAILTPEGLRRLLAVTRGTKLEVPVHIAGSTGVRRGEILALRWDNIDWERDEIYFRRSILTDDGKIVEKPPKSRTSTRIVPMTRLLRRALEAHRKEQALKNQRPGYQDLNLVVAGPSGCHIRPDSLTRCFRHLADQLGLPEIHLHSLRHTYASLPGDSEGNAKVIQEMLGHADPKMTLKYMHTQRDRQQHHRAAYLDEMLEEVDERVDS